MAESNETPETLDPEQWPVSRSFIVVFRLLLLLLAAGALVADAVITARDRTPGHSGVRYACPMHPEVQAAKPGECPICGMALEATGRDRSAISKPYREIPGITDMAAVENVRKHNIIDFVRKRSLLFNQRELRGPAWVESDGAITAVFYRDQIEALSTGEPGTFSLTQAPDIALAVHRTADPEIRWDRSTSRLRFRLDDNHAPKDRASLQPGQVGWLELMPRPRQVLTVPASAVLQSPDGPYVLASVGGFTFEKRRIEIGETFLKEGFAVILSGLHVNERVVARATFFLDADRRLGSHTGEVDWVAP